MESKTNRQQTLSSSRYFDDGTYKKKLRDELLNEGIINIIVTTILAPLQRWRIIAQTQRSFPLRPRKYKNIIDYFIKVPKQQGFFSLWRSNLTCFWIYLYQTIFQINIYDSIKFINYQWDRQAQHLPFMKIALDNVFFPLFASVTSLAIIYPVDTYRIHLAMSYHREQKDALFKKFRYRVSQVGKLRNMYNGFWLANIISVINFNFYRHLYTLWSKYQPTTSIPSYLSPELILSILAVGLVHPLDTFKKIRQLNNMHKPEIFHSYRDVIKFLKSNKMMSSLYNGFWVSIFKTTLFIPIYWQLLQLWKKQSIIGLVNQGKSRQ